MLTLPRLSIALLFVAVLALAGCGGDSDSDSDESRSDSSESSGSSGDDSEDADDPGDDVFDTCGLLTPADLEAALGSAWDEGEATHHDQTGGDQCVWGNTDPPPVKQFSIVVMREGHLSEGFENAGITVKSLFEDTKQYATDPEDVDLGDQAYLAGSTLAVLDGDTSYDFSTVLGTSPEAIAGLRSLAEQVVNR